MSEKQRKYIQAACRMAERSDDSKARSVIQSYFSEGQRLVHRSYLQQKASLRLLRLGGVMS